MNADYPDTAGGKAARQQLFSLAVTDAKQADAKVLEEATLFLGQYPGTMRAMYAIGMVDMLRTNKVLLDRAEDIARQALADFDEQRFIGEVKQEAAQEVADARAAGRSLESPMPSDDALKQRYVNIRQSLLTALGQVCVSRGNVAEGENILREAYAINPARPAGGNAAVALAELAKKAGRTEDQFEYLSAAALRGRLTPDMRAELESLHRKRSGGSLDGLEAALDARYEKERPRMTARRYQPTPGRTDRVVLAEVFTGSGCPPCVNTDLAIDAALERYGDQLAVLAYHRHVPKPDPLANPSSEARAQYYESGGYGTAGVPYMIVDGGDADPDPNGTATLESVYREVETAIEKRMTVKPETRLRLQAVRTGNLISVKSVVDKAASASRHLRLQVALAEDHVRYSGENGVRFHAMVVRALANDGAGFPLAAGRAATVSYTFDPSRITEAAKTYLDAMEKGTEAFPPFHFLSKQHEMDPAQLVVVAFVQDEDTRRVLQAAIARTNREGANR